MRTVLSLFLILVAGLVIYVGSRDLIPPKHMTFAAGSKNGGYWQLAEQYKAILARDDIDMEILETGGSVDNVALIEEGKADAGFLQGGVTGPENAESLGAVFFEPMLFFARSDRQIPANPASWTGLKIAAGGKGSGTHAGMVSFARAAKIPPGANQFLPIGQKAAADALVARQADLAMFIAPIDAQYLTALLQSQEFKIFRVDYVEAISSRLPQSQVVQIPAGAASMLPPVPPQRTGALAMVAQLIAQDTLHPSLVDRLVEAARIIHSHRDAITADRQFPTMANISLPPDSHAHNLLRDGTSPLSQFLPYWVLAQINRFVILLVPVIVLLLPMLRTVPRIYAWRMRSRVYRHYDDIKSIDTEVRAVDSEPDLEALDRRLVEIDGSLAELDLPLPYSEFAYTARLHIDLVRKRIADRLALQPVET